MVNRSILPLRAEGATVRRRGKVLIGPVDLEIDAAGGLSIVLGPNGSGKTSLLRMLHGVERLSGGRIRWDVPLREAQARQAFVFQTPILLRRSVAENLAYPLRLVGTRRAERQARAADWAQRIGLGDALERPAQLLSGGERQKLALARALVRAPQLLFLDEPCANLDGRATREIEEILLRALGQGTRIIMSTHDLGQARRLAQDVMFTYRGRLHETAAAGKFFKSPATAEARAFIRGDILE